MRTHAPAATVYRWQVTLIFVLFLFAVAGAALAGWWYARGSPPHHGPIVLLSLDRFGTERLAAYGGRGDDTPSIDALAADAVVFERAYTHSPLALPAHASLLAGQLPFEHGVRDEAGFTLREDARSLAELLRNRGFETGAAVSSFLLRPEAGVAQGFSFYDAELAEGGHALTPVVERDGAGTIAAAERWLRTRRDQRFFLFVQVGGQDAELSVSRLVTQLQELDLYDDATIILTAHRGETASGVSLDDASLRVPLVVKQPDGHGAGRRVAAPVQHIDLLPTILELVRAPIPSGLRGRSLRAVLDDENGTIQDRPIYAESLAARFRFGGHGRFALMNGQYQYVRSDREELIPLEPQTPGPAAAESEASALGESLDRLLEENGAEPPADIAAADEAHYAALGYLDGAIVAASEPRPVDAVDEAALFEALRTAAVLAAQDKYTDAIDRLHGIADSHPELTVVRYQLGELLARAGRVEEATVAFHAAAALQPDNPAVPVALARVLLKAQEHEAAWQQATRAVTLAEPHGARARADAHEIAARVALARGDADAARTHAQAVGSHAPGVPMPQYVRARLLYDEGQYAEALLELEEAEALLKEHGGSLEGLYWYFGDTLARLDRYAEAETRFREELRAYPRSIRTYSSLAMLYRALSRERGVEDVIDELVTAAPTPEGYVTAARLWMILGERERADALRVDARTRFHGDPSLALLDRRSPARPLAIP